MRPSATQYKKPIHYIQCTDTMPYNAIRVIAYSKKAIYLAEQKKGINECQKIAGNDVCVPVPNNIYNKHEYGYIATNGGCDIIGILQPAVTTPLK